MKSETTQFIKQESTCAKQQVLLSLSIKGCRKDCYFDQKYEVFFSINQFGDQQEVRDLYLQAHDIQGKGYITGIE